ncbi:MAG: iron ABC transporter permease [Desulfobacteraceae bacterium]|nr:iron ABC transporter permease [Desulfobacteraceae bacterium]
MLKLPGMDFRNTLIIFMAILAVIIFILSLGVGQYEISIKDTFNVLLSPLVDRTQEPVISKIIFKIRLPRLIACVLVGGGLAVSGTIYQGIFKNPLVSQNILGVSAGAGVAAALAIAFELSGFFIQVAAFAGGMGAVFMVMGIASLIKYKGALVFILAGVIVGGFAGSLLTLLQYIVDPSTTLASIVYWLMGSLANVGFNDIKMVYLPMTISLGILIAIRYQINVLSLGDEQAHGLGVNVKKIRFVCIVLSTTLTSSAVCIAGTIGWFGLVVPHLARLLVGDNHQKLIPMAFFAGATAMLLVDNFARTMTTTEIPLSVITGIIGAPIFTYLLFRQRLTQK